MFGVKTEIKFGNVICNNETMVTYSIFHKQLIFVLENSVVEMFDWHT